MSEDCTQRAGIDRAKEDVTCAGTPLAEGLTWVNGMPRSLSCCSTFVYETLALSVILIVTMLNLRDTLPAVRVQFSDDLGFKFETTR